VGTVKAADLATRSAMRLGRCPLSWQQATLGNMQAKLDAASKAMTTILCLQREKAETEAFPCKAWAAALPYSSDRRHDGQSSGGGTTSQEPPAFGAERRWPAGKAHGKNAIADSLLETSPRGGNEKYCGCEAKMDLPLKNSSPCGSESYNSILCFK
jgi:hypothetical protein